MTTEAIAKSPAAPQGGESTLARQRIEFRSGNEAAALAARDIGYHVMGFFPITPSTEVAENLSKMQAEGQHEIAMIAGDGEHGAAGICYGAALGGGRVLNATSSQGLLYALEQLPVQAGTRVPMVLNVAARAVSGPLDIRGDHSDFYYALNTGWIVLLARDPQAVYDLNFAAIRIGEHPDVRLPVMVVYDGFFTSHQKRRIQVFDDAAAMKALPRRAPAVADAAGHRAPGDVRRLHERPGPDQQQGAAVAGDGRRAQGHPAGLCRTRAGHRPPVRRARFLSHGRRRRGADPHQLRRRDGQGSGGRTAQRRPEGRRALAQRDAAVPVGGIPPGAQARQGRHHRRPRRFLWRRRRQPVARSARRAAARPRQPHAGALAHLRPGRQGLRRRRCEGVLQRGRGSGHHATARKCVRLPRCHAGPRGQGRTPGPAAAHRRGNVARHGEGHAGPGHGPPERRAPAAVEDDRGAGPHRSRARRLPRLRRLPDAAPDRPRARRRRRRAVPDRLRDGRDHGLPHHGAPHQLRAQPVPERRGDAVGAGRDVPRAGAARRAAAIRRTSPS